MEVGHASGGDDAAARARRASARAVWYYWGLQASCAAGDLPALNAVLARLAAARAAEEGCSEAEAARAIVVEAREASGWTPMREVCFHQKGGDGRYGCMRRLLETAGGDAARLTTTARSNGVTALHDACFGGRLSVAAAACLLVHGADATATDEYGETPRAQVSVVDPPLAALLELAERVGGRDAVIRTLIDTPHVLTDAPGWDVVRTMPRLQELQDAANLRIVIALWADARERRRDGEGERDGNAMLALLGRLPRQALAASIILLRGGATALVVKGGESGEGGGVGAAS